MNGSNWPCHLWLSLGHEFGDSRLVEVKVIVLWIFDFSWDADPE